MIPRRRVTDPRAGWTFVESIIVIGIIIVLSGTVSFSAVRYLEQARIAATRAQISAVSLALHAYYVDTGVYPTEPQGLAALWEKPTLAPVPGGWAGPYVERPVGTDSWGNELSYRRPGPAGLAFEVVSYGADGRPGGEGQDGDISSSGH